MRCVLALSEFNESCSVFLLVKIWLNTAVFLQHRLSNRFSSKACLRVSTRGGTLCVRGPLPRGRRASETSSAAPAGNQRRRTFIPRLMMMMRRRQAAAAWLKRPGNPDPSLMKTRRRSDLLIFSSHVSVLLDYF